MIADLSQAPPAGGWTTDDLDALPAGWVHRELLDGILLTYPRPPAAHQIIATHLAAALEQTCPTGLFVTQTTDVQFGRRLLFRPDVVVTTGGGGALRDGPYTPSDVTIAVEIVSSTSETMDLVLKPVLYAEAGIPYYWVIEIDDDVTVHTYRLDNTDEVYVPSGTCIDAIRLDHPWPIDIPFASLLPRNL